MILIKINKALLYIIMLIDSNEVVALAFHLPAFFRHNEMIIARARAEQETAQYRSRTSRLTKWRELVMQAQADLQLPAKAPDRIQTLGLSLLMFSKYFVLWIVGYFL